MDLPVVIGSVTKGTATDVLMHLEALQLHYPAMKRTEAEAKLWGRNWLEDVGHLPEDLIADGCRQWRRTPAERFPSPGQFLALVEPMFKHRQLLARRAAAVLEALRTKQGEAV